MYHERNDHHRFFQAGIVLSIVAVLNVIWAVQERLGHGPADMPEAAVESPLLAVAVYPPYTSIAIAGLLVLMALGFFFLSGQFDQPRVDVLDEYDVEH